MSERLNGKVIAVTGGTKGVGRAAVLRFAEEGAVVVFCGRDIAAGEEIAFLAKSKELDCRFFQADLSSADGCKSFVSRAAEQLGGLDGLLCYAGVTPVSPLDTCDERTYDLAMDVNAKASFFCCQAAIEQMRKCGGGSIVLVGSAHAWGGQKDRAAYAMSKGALLTLSDHIAKNYANEHIRSNFLVLGWTPTEGELALRAAQGESREQLLDRAAGILPMGRMLNNEDYLEALVYMMSDSSSMMTGSTFRITAGEYI